MSSHLQLFGAVVEHSQRRKILITERSLATGGKENGKLQLNFPPRVPFLTTMC